MGASKVFYDLQFVNALSVVIQFCWVGKTYPFLGKCSAIFIYGFMVEE
jgi:hypothetical protein